MGVVRERSADTDRGRIAWLQAGAGWPVVLLHAFPLTADMWRPQLVRVPREWRFIAPHLGSRRSLDEHADDVAALMDCLEIDEAVIGGLSMGGYIAFAAYRRMPSRFTGLVLADTRPQADTPDGRAGRAAMRRLLAERGVAAVADQMLPKLLSGGAAAAGVRAIIERTTPEWVDAALVAMMDRPDSTPDLGRISRPALVVVGEQDVVTPPAVAEDMHRAIARSTLVRIPGAGHLSNLEQPDLFSKALEDFLLAVI